MPNKLKMRHKTCLQQTFISEKTFIEVHTLGIQLDRQRFLTNLLDTRIVYTYDNHKQIAIQVTLITSITFITLNISEKTSNNRYFRYDVTVLVNCQKT